jgi:hypothetical protein
MKIVLAVLLALCLLPLAAQPPAGGSGGGGTGGSGGRGGRGPAVQLMAGEESQYQAKVDELESIVRALRARKTNVDLIADLDIFARTGKWLLEFPQDFTSAQAVTNYLAVLDQGIERGHQPQKGQAPWLAEKGRKVPGYSSNPDRLYVWLHGRSNGLSEASFINGFANTPKFPNTAYAADVGQLTLDCYGRGNNTNHQAGEVDIFDHFDHMWAMDYRAHPRIKDDKDVTAITGSRR